MRRVTADHPLPFDELERLAQERFGDMVKGVVDVRREVILVDAELHADQEAELLADGSTQRDLWGINLYPDLPPADWIEFDSMINVRPTQGNPSRGVESEDTRAILRSIVQELTQP